MEMHHYGKLGCETLRADDANPDRAGRAHWKEGVFNRRGQLAYWNGLDPRQHVASVCWRKVVERLSASGGECIDELLRSWFKDWHVQHCGHDGPPSSASV